MYRAFPLLLLVGCALDNPEFVEPGLPRDLGITDLTPSAAILNTALDPVPELSFQAWALDDGETAGVLSSFDLVDNYGSFQVVSTFSVFRTVADGPILVTELAYGQGVSVGDEVFFADCPYRPRVGLTDKTEGYVELELRGDPPGCNGIYGPGVTPDRLLQFDTTTLAVTLHQLDRSAGTDTLSALAPGPPIPFGVLILLVYEPEPGILRQVLHDDAVLMFEDEFGATVTAPGLDGNTANAWVGADGFVRVSTAEGLYRWDPVTEEAELLAPVPLSPTGTGWFDGAWRGGGHAEAGVPNPGDPNVTIPSAFAVRYATDDGFEVLEPPLTPCCDRDACRAYGESYLVGGFANQGKAMAVYDVWSWITEGILITHQRVARPVVDPCPE